MSLNLAQLNLAQMTMPADHPDMSDFIGNSASQAVFGPNMLVNMSVWESIEDLTEFTYKSPHLAIYKRRKEWFAKMDSPHMVCWYVEDGNIPSLEEARARIKHLQSHGETPYAFTFRKQFSMEEALAFQR